MASSTMEIDQSDVRMVELSADIESMIVKVRNAAKFFRASPVSNDALQKGIKKDLNKCLNLLLDCKTRW